MTHRDIAFIIKDQEPLILNAEQTVQEACQQMWARRFGAVLVTDTAGQLVGIFTGRDAVHALGQGKNPAHTRLALVMTRDPDCIGPRASAIEALRAMSDGGYRHLPVLSEGRILGIVSRGDFKGLELDRLEEETELWEHIA